MTRWTLGLVLGISLAVSAAAEEPAAELPEKIAAAIKGLGADEFEARKAAQAELLKIGLPAEKAVLAAADSPDPEMAGRARYILADFALRKLDVELEKVTWAHVLARVKHHAANKDWQQAGFADLLIEKSVEKVIAQANTAAKKEVVQMPVRFGDVSSMAGPGRRPGAGQLVCGQGYAEFSHCEKSIFLIDGSVRISFATNCLIIARGAVNISHGSGNVVLAGQFIDISHEGSLRRPPVGEAPASGGGSLIMSGSILRIAHAKGAICSAPDECTAGAQDCTFLNCLPTAELRPIANQVIDKVSLQLQPVAPVNPLREQLKITQVVSRGDGAQHGFIVVEHNGVEVVVRPGLEIKDNLGKPLDALAGWKLTFAGDGFALLSNGKEDAGFVVPRGE